MPRLAPEAEARQLIDRQLEQCGWEVQDPRTLFCRIARRIAWPYPINLPDAAKASGKWPLRNRS